MGVSGRSTRTTSLCSSTVSISMVPASQSGNACTTTRRRHDVEAEEAEAQAEDQEEASGVSGVVVTSPDPQSPRLLPQLTRRQVMNGTIASLYFRLFVEYDRSLHDLSHSLGNRIVAAGVGDDEEFPSSRTVRVRCWGKLFPAEEGQTVGEVIAAMRKEGFQPADPYALFALSRMLTGMAGQYSIFAVGQKSARRHEVPRFDLWGDQLVLSQVGAQCSSKWLFMGVREEPGKNWPYPWC